MNKFLKEWLPYLIIIIIVVLIRTYIVTPVIVRGDSMYDTLKDGEVLLLGKINYRLSDIKRFDIVVIKDLDGDLIIKRVIGLFMLLFIILFSFIIFNSYNHKLIEDDNYPVYKVVHLDNKELNSILNKCII